MAVCPLKSTRMKNKTQSSMRTPRSQRRSAQRTNENVALFLGPKLLGELRILMRLASNGRNQAPVGEGVKSF